MLTWILFIISNNNFAEILFQNSFSLLLRKSEDQFLTKKRQTGKGLPYKELSKSKVKKS
jgi:hypothetical protein